MDATAIYGSGNLLNTATVRNSGLEMKPFTIKSYETRMLRSDDGEENKIVLSFQEITQQLALNVTNARILIEKFGKEADAWIGKQIMMVVIKSTFQNKDSIQVKPI